MKKIIIALVIFFLLVSLGCKKQQAELDPNIASSDEALYKLGVEYLKKDPEKARLYLRQVIDSFPKSFYAQRAKLAIADSYFEKGDEGSMILAASEYREFISLFPLSPSAAYAQYQIGMTFFKKALKPGRDQTKTRQALAEFKKVVTNYPLSEEAKMAQEKIKECEERLAEHTFGIGEIYYKMGAYKAAVNRLKEILTQFPDYSKMDKVYFHLADSYYKWNKMDESIPYFTKLISDFPQSKYAKKAQKRMKYIEKRKKE
ncbi:MAG: outer membrane protein assembly factor BamD [Candidatus Aminicenantales bacterium]